MIMKGNPPLFSFDINEGNQRVSSDKLELRLGPPTKEDEAKNHVNLLEIQGGGKLQFHAPISSSSSADHMKFKHPSSSVNLAMQFSGKKGGCPPHASDNSSLRTTLPTCSQKRIAPPPSVIGWPPVRSFRKKITANSSSSKLTTNAKQEEEATELEMPKTATKTDDLFVKINMDGVPIGRKVNLRAHNNYESLSSAVDQLFRGLLAARRDASFASGNEIKPEEAKEITGMLDGNGEYTLVYEDNEGDRVLVGDVPWNMFMSTVKRLRVLKRSEISNE